MGFLDALRGRKSGGDDSNDPSGDGGKGEIGPGDPAAPDPTEFQPRSDGIYLSGAGCLQFTGQQVREAAGDFDPESARAALDGPDTRSGEYTSSGRFSLSAPFEMLVAFTVTEIGDDHFVARRTSAKDRSSAELRYTFVPSGG